MLRYRVVNFKHYNYSSIQRQISSLNYLHLVFTLLVFTLYFYLKPKH